MPLPVLHFQHIRRRYFLQNDVTFLFGVVYNFILLF